MKLVIGGTISIILGVVGVTSFFSDFLKFIHGVLPLILIIGGILVIMLKREEDAYEGAESDEQMIDSEMTAPEKVTPVKAETNESVPEENSVEKEPDTIQVPKTDPPEIEPIQSVSNFVGNESSNVFHTAACKYSSSKKCTASFESREQAIEEGYKPCNVCKP